MNNHTPEPWHIQLAQIQTGCNATTYEVVTDEYDVVSAARGIRKEADAKLIAAAPELAQALLEMACQHYCGCGHPACKSCERDKENKATLNKAGYDSPEMLK